MSETLRTSCKVSRKYVPNNCSPLTLYREFHIGSISGCTWCKAIAASILWSLRTYVRSTQYLCLTKQKNMDCIENAQFVCKEDLQIAGFGRWMYDGHRIFPAIMLFRWSSNSPVKADFVHLESDRLQRDYQFCPEGMIDHRSLDFVGHGPFLIILLRYCSMTDGYLLTTYKPRVRSLQGSPRPRPWFIDRAIAQQNHF